MTAPFRRALAALLAAAALPALAPVAAQASPAPVTTTVAPAPSPGQRVLSAALARLGQGPQAVLTPAQIAAGTAWCSEFASLVYAEAGAGATFVLGTPGSAVNTSTNRWWTWASNNGRLRWADPALKTDPTAPNSILSAVVAVQPGDIVLEWHFKSTTNAWSSHTAIIESVTTDSTGRRVFATVDGNWSGVVKRRVVDSDTKGKIFAVISPGS